MERSNSRRRVSQSAPKGENEWSKVPRCVREALASAIVGALPGESRRRLTPNRNPSRAKSTCANKIVVPQLTEEFLHRSVQTFEDAAVLRAEAVRSYAQFHNTVEMLREVMRNQLGALWYTALQLDPEFVIDLQQQNGLSGSDLIPNDVVIEGESLKRLEGLETLLQEMNNNMEVLRSSSVRFAACVLSDEEKLSMGLDPLRLPREDVLRYAAAPSTRRNSSSRGRQSNKDDSSNHGRRSASARRPTLRPDETEARLKRFRAYAARR
ncbi:uncharacterized protein TEOVI_000141900 [Trypanosoma equiperdum]|uniref:Uncharacterized protein n=1 Tax=Trypanosoma equiperdum TaxID=5694 RepID=A0A1G4IC59_TRYEQ|nr:hypothetical protein, conserved [Trypanosoma equiperdum]